jgi:hypothetical protein
VKLLVLCVDLHLYMLTKAGTWRKWTVVLFVTDVSYPRRLAELVSIGKTIVQWETQLGSYTQHQPPAKPHSTTPDLKKGDYTTLSRALGPKDNIEEAIRHLWQARRKSPAYQQ